MLNVYQLSIFVLTIIIIFLLFLKNRDWFTFFIVLKSLYLLISVTLLHEVVIYNSSGILVSILYILCVSVLKSVIRILLIVINQNKNNSLFI